MRNRHINDKTFSQALAGAKTIFAQSKNISCEGLRYEIRFLAAWIAIHSRQLGESHLSHSQRIRALRQASFLSKEILRCLDYVYQTGQMSAGQYQNLEKNYRLINAQLGQWEREADARRWLGRIIRIYHGEKSKKGGFEHENNDRFSINGSNAFDEHSRVRAVRVCD